jgi:hypothetical protein
VDIERVYLMTDYGSSSLWSDEPCHLMIPAEMVGLSRETADALAAWSANLFEALEHEDDEDWLWDFARRERAEGLRLWEIARRELEGRCEVGYAVGARDAQGRVFKRVVWDPADFPDDDAWSPSA